jgi:hypothetical protein
MTAARPEEKPARASSFIKSARARATIRTVLQNLVIYGIAAVIIWYEARGIPIGTLLKDLAGAKLLWFIPASLVSFSIWFFGENLLYTRMFSHFN